MAEDSGGQTSLDAFNNPPRTLHMPSMEQEATTPTNDVVYHDLGKMYPHPPVPVNRDGLVIHRAILHDVTGVGKLLDWLADGEAAIIEMERLMARDVELQAALKQLSTFIENDLGGQIVKVTESRLMLLPSGCKGLRGVEVESTADEPSSDLARGYL
ncbi:MAG: hypothetical protein ACKVJ7_05220 [Candidatus Poseidoniales archaeon]|jgi:SepF-like predicted cell division protein (DUF552 family)